MSIGLCDLFLFLVLGGNLNPSLSCRLVISGKDPESDRLLPTLIIQKICNAHISTLLGV